MQAKREMAGGWMERHDYKGKTLPQWSEAKQFEYYTNSSGNTVNFFRVCFAATEFVLPDYCRVPFPPAPSASNELTFPLCTAGCSSKYTHSFDIQHRSYSKSETSFTVSTGVWVCEQCWQ